ncbi:helix-turn-helix domain-containing protein [Acutalibacter sp. LFL-21]
MGLSPGEMTLYAYLIYCEDWETHQCWPSVGRICQHTA